MVWIFQRWFALEFPLEATSIHIILRINHLLVKLPNERIIQLQLPIRFPAKLWNTINYLDPSFRTRIILKYRLVNHSEDELWVNSHWVVYYIDISIHVTDDWLGLTGVFTICELCKYCQSCRLVLWDYQWSDIQSVLSSLYIKPSRVSTCHLLDFVISEIWWVLSRFGAKKIELGEVFAVFREAICRLWYVVGAHHYRSQQSDDCQESKA